MGTVKKNLLENAKKTDRKAKAFQKLGDDQLEEVSGGYWEDAGWAEGYWIQCPKCGRSAKSSFYTEIIDNKEQVDGYECKCGYVFGVDSQGNYWE